YSPAGVPGYGTAPGVTVTSRARPDFDPPGLHAGDFLLHPSLEEGFGYDDNVFGSNVARRGSWVIGTHPSLLAGSDWSENSLVGYLGLDDLRYLDQPRQSETNWTASLGGTVSLGRDTLTMAAAHFNLHQPRTDLDALPTDEPVAYQVNDVRIGYTANLGRWSLTPGLAFSTYRYDATTIRGLPASQAYRDRNVLQGSVTARYEVAPERHLLMVLRVLGENFTSPQLGQPTRNSTGYEALAGYGDDSDPVWRYRVLVGWEMRAFQAPQFSTHQAPIAEAALIWSPSGMTTITATLTRSIEDAAQEGIAGYTYSRARVVIDHEYLRNVLLQVSSSAQYAQYLPAGGYGSSFTLGVGTTWLVNRNMRLSATYDFTDQHGSSAPTLQTTGSYTRSIALVTLRFGI
ncbi:MAG TPA: outer membrane beta-barrel protein, partial [Acetobacteraceae bacterium]|nr:outer membrane beta-barrel protein [Acetobacteraceae bacterium]